MSMITHDTNPDASLDANSGDRSIASESLPVQVNTKSKPLIDRAKRESALPVPLLSYKKFSQFAANLEMPIYLLAEGLIELYAEVGEQPPIPEIDVSRRCMIHTYPDVHSKMLELCELSGVSICVAMGSLIEEFLANQKFQKRAIAKAAECLKRRTLNDLRICQESGVPNLVTNLVASEG